MRNPFLIFIFFISFISCCNTKQTAKEEEIKGVLLTRKFPLLELDSTINKLVVKNYTPFFAKIFYYKGYTLIQQSYRFQEIWANNLEEKRTPFVDKYKTFVFDTNSKIAVFYKELDISSMAIVNKDSIFKNEWSLNPQRDNLFIDNECKLMSTSNQDNEVIEKYSMTNKSDISMVGLVTLIFSKTRFQDIPYSLAPVIEKEKGMKLVKITYVNHERFLAVQKCYISEVEIPYELQDLNINNVNELKQVFNDAITALK